MILTLLGCYVLSSGYYQAELMSMRVPNEQILAQGVASAGQEQRLRLVVEIKAYGKEMGFSSTHNYDTTAWSWDRAIYNVSACDPVSFTSKTWSFPIVGTVPYLGYFRPEDAERQKQQLLSEGLDVWVRTAGAYSTLGWFRDPLLPGMFLWDEPGLAETIFHELAHATLWVPGSVNFNESFASFLGEVAADQYLADRYGPQSEIRTDYQTLNEDYRIYQDVLHTLYKDLDTLYQTPEIRTPDKLTQKEALFLTLPSRVEASNITHKDRFVAAARRGPWNNARLAQYRTYNTSHDQFARLLTKQNNNLSSFIDAIRAITKNQDDPFAALARALE